MTARSVRPCDCTDGNRNQALINCPHCRGEGVITTVDQPRVPHALILLGGALFLAGAVLAGANGTGEHGSWGPVLTLSLLLAGAALYIRGAIEDDRAASGGHHE